MLFEDLPGRVFLRPSQRLFRLRASMSETVLRRLLLGMTPLGLFAHGAKVDDRSHESSTVAGCCCPEPFVARMVELLRRHATLEQPLVSPSNATAHDYREKCGYTPDVGQDTPA